MKKIRLTEIEMMLSPKVEFKTSKSLKKHILGYCTLLMSFAICMITSCEHYHSDFYHPDKIIYYPEETVETVKCRVLNVFDCNITDMICNNDNIIFQMTDSTIFKIYSIAAGKITASFANIGHANNEFETTPKCSYKNSLDKNKLYVVEQNGLLTKIIDLQKSIQTKTCIVSNVLKHPNNACGTFYSTYYNDNGTILYNKDVSYKDASDNIFDPPTHGIINNGNIISSNVFPQSIISKQPNNVFNAYANRTVASPNKKYLANVFVLSDIINIYDVENKEDIALLGSGVNDFAFFQTLNNDDDILNKTLYYHLAACGSDKYLFVLKTSVTCKEFEQMNRTGDFSGFHQELVMYDWKSCTVRKAGINHIYPIVMFDYEELSGKLYAIDCKNQLIELNLNIK
ncbi:MAG: hypothetical protein MJZ20_03270 [Bacteroidaceae bacterium]|nr:hypothetical protein [Bacteroidaceae bacterium]